MAVYLSFYPTLSKSLICVLSAALTFVFDCFIFFQHGPFELCRSPQSTCRSVLQRECPQGAEGKPQERSGGRGQELYN